MTGDATFTFASASTRPSGRTEGTRGARGAARWAVSTRAAVAFPRTGLAWAGVLPAGRGLPSRPRAAGQGTTSALHTTLPRTFPVPPRRHRSFPLVDLIR